MGDDMKVSFIVDQPQLEYGKVALRMQYTVYIDGPRGAARTSYTMLRLLRKCAMAVVTMK